MVKYEPEVPDQLKDPNYSPSKYSFVSLEGFLNAVVLVEVLKKAPKELTRQNFIETLESIQDLDVGIGSKISFGKARHQAMDAVFFTTIKNGKYVLVDDWTLLK